MPHTLLRSARGSKLGVAAVLAVGLLGGTAAPSAVAATWPQDQASSGATRPNTAFHRHFWRGSQLSQTSASRAEMTALADEPTQIDAAMSYCANRFRSYDPSTGTYLGYDGNEHPCP